MDRILILPWWELECCDGNGGMCWEECWAEEVFVVSVEVSDDVKFGALVGGMVFPWHVRVRTAEKTKEVREY